MNVQKKRMCIVRRDCYPNDPRISKEIQALAEAGYEMDLICLRNPGEPRREQIHRIHIYRLLNAPRRGSAVRYILEYLHSILIMGMFLTLLFFKRRHACIQVNTLPDALVFITLLPRLCGARILLDLQEPSPELLLSKYGSRVPENVLRMQIVIERYAIRYAHKVITVNDTIRKRFIERGADPGKISVVRNVPPENFGEKAPVRKPHEGLVLITHGTLQPRYGHSVLLHALPLIRQHIHPLRVFVAGPGETLEELKELCSELHCDDIVTFTGQIPREQVVELIVQADIGIVPLLPGPFSELCQPNKLFEFIALKTQVAASRLPALEESFDDSCIRFVRAGDAGDLAAAIIQLGKDAALRKSLADKAFARYQTLRWSNVKHQYVSLVNSLTGNCPDAN
jgi:glycosyltransferase involved in cell wall biosynthesis